MYTCEKDKKNTQYKMVIDKKLHYKIQRINVLVEQTENITP